MSPPSASGPDAVMGAPTHPCALGLLVREVGEYLVGADAPEAEQRHAAQHAFRHGRADFEAFAASQRRGTDLVFVELAIHGSVERCSVHTHLPGPLSLLLVSARNCIPGDVVSVRQVTAKCGEIRHEARFPVGMAEAEAMTRPADSVFRELAAGGAERVHRRVRTLGRLGTLVVERETSASEAGRPGLRHLWPRLWGWRPRSEGSGPLTGLRFRWRRTRLRVGWCRRHEPVTLAAIAHAPALARGVASG